MVSSVATTDNGDIYGGPGSTPFSLERQPPPPSDPRAGSLLANDPTEPCDLLDRRLGARGNRAASNSVVIPNRKISASAAHLIGICQLNRRLGANLAIVGGNMGAGMQLQGLGLDYDADEPIPAIYTTGYAWLDPNNISGGADFRWFPAMGGSMTMGSLGTLSFNCQYLRKDPDDKNQHLVMCTFATSFNPSAGWNSPASWVSSGLRCDLVAGSEIQCMVRVDDAHIRAALAKHLGTMWLDKTWLQDIFLRPNLSEMGDLNVTHPKLAQWSAKTRGSVYSAALVKNCGFTLSTQLVEQATHHITLQRSNQQLSVQISPSSTFVKRTFLGNIVGGQANFSRHDLSLTSTHYAINLDHRQAANLCKNIFDITDCNILKQLEKPCWRQKLEKNLSEQPSELVHDENSSKKQIRHCIQGVGLRYGFLPAAFMYGMPMLWGAEQSQSRIHSYDNFKPAPQPDVGHAVAEPSLYTQHFTTNVAQTHFWPGYGPTSVNHNAFALWHLAESRPTQWFLFNFDVDISTTFFRVGPWLQHHFLQPLNQLQLSANAWTLQSDGATQRVGFQVELDPKALFSTLGIVPTHASKPLFSPAAMQKAAKKMQRPVAEISACVQTLQHMLQTLPSHSVAPTALPEIYKLVCITWINHFKSIYGVKFLALLEIFLPNTHRLRPTAESAAIGLAQHALNLFALAEPAPPPTAAALPVQRGLALLRRLRRAQQLWQRLQAMHAAHHATSFYPQKALQAEDLQLRKLQAKLYESLQLSASVQPALRTVLVAKPRWPSSVQACAWSLLLGFGEAREKLQCLLDPAQYWTTQQESVRLACQLPSHGASVLEIYWRQQRALRSLYFMQKLAWLCSLQATAQERQAMQEELQQLLTQLQQAYTDLRQQPLHRQALWHSLSPTWFFSAAGWHVCLTLLYTKFFKSINLPTLRDFNAFCVAKK